MKDWSGAGGFQSADKAHVAFSLARAHLPFVLS